MFLISHTPDFLPMNTRNHADGGTYYPTGVTNIIGRVIKSGISHKFVDVIYVINYETAKDEPKIP